MKITEGKYYHNSPQNFTGAHPEKGHLKILRLLIDRSTK
jgi:hypothetical protein